MYSFSYLEPVYCSMSSSNCCFLTCIQVSQEAGHVVWYSHLFQNFPQFIVIHTVKGFGIVKKAEIDVFLELSCFFDDPITLGKHNSGEQWIMQLPLILLMNFISTVGCNMPQIVSYAWPYLTFAIAFLHFSLQFKEALIYFPATDSVSFCYYCLLQYS